MSVSLIMLGHREEQLAMYKVYDHADTMSFSLRALGHMEKHLATICKVVVVLNVVVFFISALDLVE